MSKIYTDQGDRLVGERIVASYQDFTPKSGYRVTNDGAKRDDIKKICHMYH